MMMDFTIYGRKGSCKIGYIPNNRDPGWKSATISLDRSGGFLNLRIGSSDRLFPACDYVSLQTIHLTRTL